MSISAILDSKAALKQLGEAASGLLYISESDAPFDLVYVSAGTANFAAADARKVVSDLTAPVAETSIAEFFAVPTQGQDWYGEQENADLARYRTLRSIFAEKLSLSRVYRIGVVRVYVIVIGRATDGGWVGVRTMAVET